MNKVKEFIQSREFVKYFLMFFSGTLLAQIVTIAISPILTRIYTPEDFGIYGVYLSIVSLLIVFATGRYEFAINSVKTEEDAVSIYKIVNYLTVFVSGFLLIVILMSGETIVRLLNLQIDPRLLIFVPFTILVLGFLQSSTYYLNRHKKFEVLSKSKIYQSIANAVSSLSAGFMSFGALGLVLANVVSVFSSQLYQRLRGVRSLKVETTREQLIANLKKHKDYPLYNAPSAFFDTLALQAPVLILVRFFSESIVGFYSLTVRVLGLPLTLISTSISQVFLSQVSELNREGKSYRGVIVKVAKYLALIGIFPLLGLMLLAPSLFSLVFGSEWRLAGEYAQILMIGYYFKFVISPLSMVFFINQKIRLLSVIQTIRAFSTVLTLLVLSSYFEVQTVLIGYTIHECLFYVVYFYNILRTSN
ncbi:MULTISPECIES: lipopolysaccharide biosynthesis protein [unclassified Sporosarcina]|uniref:lipopolysaccharide biosynthesis protein n=1 Tax=unclassified Sporosarcina TaxID=2647733 RepID=UPI00203C1B5A|nr:MULTISPECIES: oligosaccharide flippase family protein [unclassified Sporosarcina]GKV66230.1 polysaccharide biosynthesis protein [Sporosarcina sp. NCCP-2331]GLB56266.1 polysaccharide biosynthesis protein [Sporosarcina sp. NCCP-2378]